MTSMFYTRKEHTQRVGYWCTYRSTLLKPFISLTSITKDMTGMFGASCLGFVAFGLLHVTVSPTHRSTLKTIDVFTLTQGTRLMQWQW